MNVSLNTVAIKPAQCLFLLLPGKSCRLAEPGPVAGQQDHAFALWTEQVDFFTQITTNMVNTTGGRNIGILHVTQTLRTTLLVRYPALQRGQYISLVEGLRHTP